MKLFHILIATIVFIFSYIDASAYLSSTHPVCTGTSSCATSCSAGSASHISGSTLYCYSYCGVDQYYNGASCIGVGVGYYSPNANDSRYACTNSQGDTASRDYNYSGSGNGGNNCPATAYTNLCGVDLYESSNGVCSGVGVGYYSPAWNNGRYTCSNAQGDNASRDYYYTGSGNGGNSCPAASYTPLCGTDLYESSNGVCSAVGTGYYSPSSNNTRYSCTGLGASTASRSYYWTSDGNGTNSCGQTYANLCGTDLYESSNGVCSSVGTGYYSPSSNNTRYTCSNAQGDTASRDYYYTGSGNGGNSCPAASYTPLCGTDLYESSNGVCSVVGTGYYSPAGNNTRYTCSNAQGDNASRDYYYTGSGNGGNSCPAASYTPLCGTDLYESSNGVCSAVGTGYYSPNPHNTRFTCSNKPANSYYTGDGNGTNNCSWACDSGWSSSGGSCIDTTNPTAGAASYSPSAWTNGDVIVTVSCSDAQTGCSSPTFSTTRTANGPGTLYVYDNAGNSAGRAYNVTNIDKTIPTGTAGYSPSSWTNGSVTVTITCSDTQSGCNMVAISGWTVSGNNYVRTVSSNTSGTITIRDNAGNTNNINYNVANIDTTSPSVSANNASATAWRNNMAMNITLSASDSGGSGISYRKYSWDTSDAICRTAGTSFTDGQNITSTTIPGNSQGTHTLYLCVRDIAGNINQWNGVYKFDNNNPVVFDNYVLDNIWSNMGGTISFTANDPNGSSANSISNIQTTKYCWGVGCSPATGTVGTSVGVAPDIDNTLRYQTWDNAGNASSIGSIIVRLEDNNPATTMSFNRLGSATVYTPDSWVNYDVRGTINCTDSTGAVNSGCDNASRQYRVQTSSFTCNSGGTWTNYNGTGVDMTETVGNESVRYICSRVKDIATNGYVYSPVYTVRIDKDTPDFTDLTATAPFPNNGSKLFADIHNVVVTAVRDGGSPITLIEGHFEDSSTSNSYGAVLQSTSDLNSANAEVLSINANMTNVDRDRHATGYRQYSFKITKIQDEAGNITTDPITGVGLPNILYYVFANSSDLSGVSGSYAVTTNQLSATINVADGANKDVIITLKDRYGNQIVPASDINRQIDFNFNVSNNLALNQYNSTGDAVFLNRPAATGVFNNRLSSTALFTNEPSTNGEYKYTFQVYSPTYLSGATDGRQWANGDMTIHNIDYTIKQNPSAYIAATHSGTVIDSNIGFVFKPLYKAEFTGDLSQGLFVDSVQTANLNIVAANATPVSNSSIRLGFGQTNGTNNNVAHPNYNLIYNPDSAAVTVTEGHQSNINSLYNLGTLPGNKSFDVKITQESGPVDPSLATYVSSHIKYDLNGKTVIYDGNTVGKPRYVDGTNLVNTSQVGLKVLGRIQSKNQTDLTTGQSGTDLYALGNNSKAGLRELIRKQATLEVKNISGATSGIVTDLRWNTWSLSNGGTRLRNNKVLYYDLAPGTNLQIGNGSNLVASGVKTIIARGGNVYMKNNITYTNKSSDMLGVISLADDAGNGGNIYLDTEVTSLVGIYYADKALISYDGTNEIDGSVGTSILKNQFYLYGTLFSENTIGGSIIPKCPYYITTTCDINLARKYDLNFLRRYFTYDNNDVDTLENNIYNGGNSHFSYGNNNFKYPMVIEYNPNVQTNPPPVFENNEF